MADATSTPDEFPVWGYGSPAMYRQRWALIAPHLADRDFVLVDWGSDAGWFSIRTATTFPKATVISVEAGIMTGGAGIAEHQRQMAARGVTNNRMVDTLFGPITFDGLGSVPADYQFVLSVFHHMGDGFGRYLNTVEEWDDSFCALVQGANVTFFEVPNEGVNAETPHRIREWYAGREVEPTVRAALQRGGVDATVERLGEAEHGDKGTRIVFKITLAQPRTVASPDAIAAYIAKAGEKAQPRPYRRLRLFASEIKRALVGKE